MKTLEVIPCSSLSGRVSVPGDKSISHRALMFSSLAQGQSTIENLLEGHDCIATLQVMRSLGVHISLEDNRWIVNGRGKAGFLEPTSILDCKNSGTTMRLLAGLLSAMPFMTILDGSDQIKTRPMGRVIQPLTTMGARIFGRSSNRLAPIVTLPSSLRGVQYDLQMKSAQVKSALILAGLFADSPTRITNTAHTRDHTERLLNFMGASIELDPDSVRINPLKGELHPISLTVPGDISSAAFLIVLGVLRSEKGITITDVGVNETRSGIIDALRMMGAKITLSNLKTIANEPVADIFVEKSDLVGATFAGDHIVRMIDEIPVLALAATQAIGTTVIKDAFELKVKESNRIARTVELLQTLGAHIEETDDGMIINGKTTLIGGAVASHFDHRMALMLTVAGLVSSSMVVISNADVTDDSFPGYVNVIRKLGGDVREVNL